MAGDKARRHCFIPDAQIRPNSPLDFIPWISQAVCEYTPDVIIVGGDWWDMHSLNSHEEPGSLPMEGARYVDDLKSGEVAFNKLCLPIEKKIAKSNTWNPRKIFLQGNHEERADRVSTNSPKWEGFVSARNNCRVRDFEWHDFLERVEVDGIVYSHYFQNTHSGRAIGGTIDNRLNKIGQSFVQGHEQGFRYGCRIMGNGKTYHGLVAGSCYLQEEDYRGNQGQKHWRGIVILNDVKNGNFDIMGLSLSYLCHKYTGENIVSYMTKRYPGPDWSYLEL